MRRSFRSGGFAPESRLNSSSPGIHPTALIGPQVELGAGVTIGPYAVIDGEVRLGEGCRLGPHVHLTGQVEIGDRNVFHAGCVIGDVPQDISFAGGKTKVVIGSDNTFREHVTVHRSNSEEEATRIGSGNLFMAGSHVGHNAVIGNRAILANSVLIGGHAVIGDRAVLGGNSGVHQFVRIGRLALLQGNSGLSNDLPPFFMACRINELAGLNVVGLKRAELASGTRLQLKKLYHLLFRRKLALSVAVQQASEEFTGVECREVLDFIRDSRRGVCYKTRS